MNPVYSVGSIKIAGSAIHRRVMSAITEAPVLDEQMQSVFHVQNCLITLFSYLKEHRPVPIIAVGYVLKDTLKPQGLVLHADLVHILIPVVLPSASCAKQAPIQMKLVPPQVPNA